MKYKHVIFDLLKKTKLLLFLFPLCLSAQKSEVGNWLIYFGNHSFKTKWNWHNEVQYRNYNAIGDLEQLLIRTGIGCNLKENNANFLIGYAYIKSQRYLSDTTSIFTEEHRIYQQFIMRQNFGRFFIQHRYRLEERFFTNDTRFRFRYFLGVTIPINKPSMDKNAIYLSAYNELFIHTNSPLYDRNRLYGAIGFVFHKSFRAEIGFMSQLFEKTSRQQFQVVLFNNLPFPIRKKLSVTAQ